MGRTGTYGSIARHERKFNTCRSSSLGILDLALHCMISHDRSSSLDSSLACIRIDLVHVIIIISQQQRINDQQIHLCRSRDLLVVCISQIFMDKRVCLNYYRADLTSNRHLECTCKHHLGTQAIPGRTVWCYQLFPRHSSSHHLPNLKSPPCELYQSSK